MAEHHNNDTEEKPITRTTIEARQGGRRLENLRVLIVSFGVAFLVLAGLYLFFFHFPF